jgi:phage shock protein E
MKKSILMMALALCALHASAKNVVIDVRTAQEYATGHIGDAINIDYTVIGQEISKANVAKDDTVILYCRTGHRSGIALETLKKLGYSKAENYGGINQARTALEKR